MGRVPVDCKKYKGKKYYPSSYLAKKLYLSPERSRAVLQDYENISELGTNPKFYDKQLLDKIIDDYNNDKIKSKALQKRKEKERAKKIRLEEERAKAEKLTYESSEPMERPGSFFLANQMKEKLVSTMLNNLFAALGYEFDLELFYEDIEKIADYECSVRKIGVARPLDIVEAENRLLGNDGYLKNKNNR
ncbi:TPA: hypothetical protein U1B89_002091 [Streptococcus suis]|nr:hypothetical protein [Streptococcus suis]